ncbi:hypothetical protein JCM8097_000376 [Rhodosporidiobolus ruineniae]
MPSQRRLLSSHTSQSPAPRAPSSRPSTAFPSGSPAAPDLAHNARQVRWGTDQVIAQLQGTASQTDETREGDDEEDEKPDGGSILAIAAMKRKLGCCYFDAAVDKLYFIEDQADSNGWDLANLILEQLLPNTVLTSISADADFLTTLEATLSTLPVASTSSAASSAGEDQPVRLEYRPKREFYAGQGKLALAQLPITEGGGYAATEHESEQSAEYAGDGQGADGGDTYLDGEGGERDPYDFGMRRKKRRVEADFNGDRSRRNRELRLEGFLNGLNASPITLGCAGALLSFVSRSRSSAGELDGDGFEVRGLELLKLDKVMHINSDALTSLQIFSDEAHASVHSSASKEGLSLFGIVNIARTPLGRVLMKQWFLRPSLEVDVINSRHAAVECFLRSENQHVVDAISSHLRNIKNVPRTVKALQSGRGGVGDWTAAWKVFFGMVMIRDAVANLVHRKGVEVVDKILATFDIVGYKEVGQMIDDVIDWEASNLQKGRVCVKNEIDKELDEWRRQLAGLSSLLSKIASQISSALPPQLATSIPHLSLVYFPQLGYLICIPFEPDVVDAGKYGSVGWDFQFVTEMSAYFKNDKCYDLDKYLGDVQNFISVHALLGFFDRIVPSLLAATDLLSELDCLIAFAEASRLYEWNRPKMVKEPVCEIVNGRHPLAELCVESFVRNSTSLVGGHGASAKLDLKPSLSGAGEDAATNDKNGEGEEDEKKSMMVLTGANFSGKSVYLKQVALIVFLAHIGCFVPAEEATIGLTDRILTRVSTRESITRGASAFMIDLQQVSFLLRNLTPSSLVLLDEFGKGTEPDDGAGLFCGVVEELVGRGEGAPRTLIATHCQHVFLNGLLSRRLPGVELAHMEVLVAEDSERASTAAGGGGKGEVDKLTYLYRVAPGLALASHAASCALLFGLPLPVVQRATEVTHLLSTFELDALSLAEEPEARRREVREGERVGRGLLEWELGGDVEGEGESVESLKRRLRRLVGMEDEDEEQE